jgi:hypothetical protein
VKVTNHSNWDEEIEFLTPEVTGKVFSGAVVSHGKKSGSIVVCANRSAVIPFYFIALASGYQSIPKISLVSRKYALNLLPEIELVNLFVFPTEERTEM